MSTRSKSAATSSTKSVTKATKSAAKTAKGSALKPASVAEAAKGPAFTSPRELAAALGVTLKPPLKPNQVRRLRKPLPGYAATLNDTAELVATDGAALGLPEGEAEELFDMQRRYKALRTNETVLETVYLSVYYQRLLLDDEAMGALQRIARRVQSRAEEDPQLPLRWSTLLDFLGAFRKNGRAPVAVEAPPPANDSEVLARSFRQTPAFRRARRGRGSWRRRPMGRP